MPTGIRVRRGRMRQWDVTVVIGSQARNITNDVVLFTVKSKFQDSDESALFQLKLSSTISDGMEILDAPNGKFRLTIDGSRTRNCPAKRTPYVYDMKILYGGDPDFAYDLDSGSFTVEPDVTNATGV